MRKLFCYFVVLVCILVIFTVNSFAETDRLTIQNLQNATDEELAGALQTIEAEMLKKIKAHIELDQTELRIEKGKTATLVPELSDLDEELTAEAFTWSSSDETIATVTAKGQVKGIEAGNAVITCSSLLSNGFTLKAECQVQVFIPVKGITANQKALTLARGTQSIIEYSVAPEDATDKNVEFISSDETVATVKQDGTVTSEEIGDCTITIAAKDGSEKKLDIKISVRQEVQSISIETSNDFVAVGKTIQLKGIVDPETANNKKIEWSSADETIANVDKNGKVTGVAVGNTTITAKATDGTDTEANFEMKVIQPMKSIIVEDKPLYLCSYTSWKQNISIEPENTTNKSIIWTSSNDEVATIDENGTITTKFSGKCIITGTAADGSGAKIEIPVEIKGFHYVFLSPEEIEVDFHTVSEGLMTAMGIDSYGRAVNIAKSVEVDYGNGHVISEERGKIKPVKPGSDKITVKYITNGRETSKIEYEVFVAQSAFEPEE